MGIKLIAMKQKFLLLSGGDYTLASLLPMLMAFWSITERSIPTQGTETLI